jgi:DNA ligase 1
MRLFARLYSELDATTKMSVKVEALERYFRDAPAADAAWALFFLTGGKIKRAVSVNEIRDAALEATNLPSWLLHECYDAVGDLSETLALLLPEPATSEPLALHEIVERIIVPMRRDSEAGRRQALKSVWNKLPSDQRFLFHKLLGGEFRVGVARTLTVRALAAVAGVTQAEMEHRVMGHWEPTPDAYAAIIGGSTASDQIARPYPFFLASQLDGGPEALGEPAEWLIEWKWDGIRAQLIRREGRTFLWSRGEELITDRYPEIASAAAALPDGTVLDGEILAWERGADRPLPFAALQTRIGRTRHSSEGGWLFVETPVIFMAYDVLERERRDTRTLPMGERRSILERLLTDREATIRPSPIVTGPGGAGGAAWDDLVALQRSSRERGVEGLMLKRITSAYGTGRTRGDWWKWKIAPYTVDTVMIAAQPGHGRRASLFTDYTFGVWSGERSGEGELVPVAKAYSGLTDEEIRRVDKWVRAHTTGKFGPVRTVEPQLVFEIAFEAIAASTRHKSGIAVRFPRIARWRDDKKPVEADTLGSLQRLLRSVSR